MLFVTGQSHSESESHLDIDLREDAIREISFLRTACTDAQTAMMECGKGENTFDCF